MSENLGENRDPLRAAWWHLTSFELAKQDSLVIAIALICLSKSRSRWRTAVIFSGPRPFVVHEVLNTARPALAMPFCLAEHVDFKLQSVSSTR